MISRIRKKASVVRTFFDTLIIFLEVIDNMDINACTKMFFYQQLIIMKDNEEKIDTNMFRCLMSALIVLIVLKTVNVTISFES